MQRKVLLCRHAESKDPYPLQPDFERELTSDGEQQAREAGTWLRSHISSVDIILSSPAKRAQSTASAIATKLYIDTDDIKFIPDIYNARESVLMHCLAGLPSKVQTVLLVAHNPGITRLARELTGKMLGYLEPSCVVTLSIELEDWEEIYHTTGTISESNMAIS